MKGIMFKENLFNAIIEGGKTQTRRVIKQFPGWVKQVCADGDGGYIGWEKESEGNASFTRKAYEGKSEGVKPRYKPSETVYLKEPYFPVLNEDESLNGILYKYDDKPKDDLDNELRDSWPWNNKMFIPEKYARYFIQVTDVRVERLRVITRTDIRAEGLACPKELCGDDVYPNYKQWYPEAWAKLWDSINSPPYSWSDNPWVWVYEFELVKTSVEWAKEIEFEILDPDGWDRKNFDFSFNEELISKKEFNKRLIHSTLTSKASNNHV